MSNLTYRQSKIQEKRKYTYWRKCVVEIGSWLPLMFYKNQGFISKYPPNTGRVEKLVSPRQFEQQRESLVDSGLNYKSTMSFFEQFHQLFKTISVSSLFSILENENCDYVEDAFGAKNGYLSFGVGTGSENVLYSCLVKDKCTNVLNSVEVIDGSQNVYFSGGITNSYNIFYSRFLTDCANIRFSTNLIGCQECLFCDNLQNKSNCIENKQYEKEEYILKKTELLVCKSDFLQWQEKTSVHGTNFASINCEGSFIVKSSDVDNGKYVYKVKSGRNLFMVGGEQGNENMVDIIVGGGMGAKDAYASIMFGLGSEHLYCVHHVINSSHIYYSRSMETCSFCFGCIGLKNKSYCILNKQYRKEERYTKVDEIFGKMNEDGVLGDFFPATMNPFYFNDTAAYLIDPTFTKEEVTAKGYLRRDDPIKVDIPEGALIVKTSELERFESFNSQGNWEIDPEVLKYIIVDDQSNVYRIVKMEYDFLMKHGLPLPRKHWLERMKENFRIRS